METKQNLENQMTENPKTTKRDIPDQANENEEEESAARGTSSAADTATGTRRIAGNGEKGEKWHAAIAPQATQGMHTETPISPYMANGLRLSSPSYGDPFHPNFTRKQRTT
ncbi:hypothetical protein JCGZ_08848 [Jatropha curcas]|uniref:Uncharacterized protein n=1 Tax=Jatropha curcas TaxID=180498 RepID=A0A067KXY2_JATCU|nr:hypothetical protein JCGZ_08848 [Jatropha curcas]